MCDHSFNLLKHFITVRVYNRTYKLKLLSTKDKDHANKTAI